MPFTYTHALFINYGHLFNWQCLLLLWQVSREFCLHIYVRAQWNAIVTVTNTLESSGTFLWIAKYRSQIEEKNVSCSLYSDMN